MQNKFLVIGGSMLVIALFLPVMSVNSLVGTINISGFESDLVVSAALGLIALFTGFANTKAAQRIGGILGPLSLFITVNMLLNVASLSSGSDLFMMSIGPAAPLAALGGLITVGGLFPSVSE